MRARRRLRGRSSGAAAERGETLLRPSGRAVYEPNRIGWFAMEVSDEALREWVVALSLAAHGGEWDDGAKATRLLLERAERYGSLLERHVLPRTLRRAVVRTLQREGARARHRALCHWAFWNLRGLALRAVRLSTPAGSSQA